MKLLLFGLVLLLAFGSGVFALYVKARNPKYLTIEIKDVATSQGVCFSPGVDQAGTAFYGPMSWENKAKTWRIEESLSTSFSTDKPTVKVHFVIDRDGTSNQVDVTLPVSRIAGGQKWSKLDEHIITTAYTGDGVIIE